MKLKAATILAVICAVLAVPGTALATSPSQDAYSGVAGAHQNGTTPPSVDAAAVEVGPVSETEVQSAGSTLPFTGLEVGLIALVGVALLGGGVVMYRLHGRTRLQV
jgi:hypothetical protein